MKWIKRLPFLLVAAGLMAWLVIGQNETIITVAAPSFYEEAVLSAIDDFQAENPGVKVIYVEANPNWPTAASNVEEHLGSVGNYTSVADVLFFASDDVAPATTRANLLLDVMPLAENDPALSINDFYPALWQSFQWDRGLWALPISGELEVVLYDKNAFDAAGLFYPDENWGITEVENAANALAEYDQQGEIVVPGAQIGNIELLFRTLYARGFYDDTLIPNEPLLGTPDLINLAEQWLEVQQTGVLGPFIGLDFDQQDVPLRLGSPVELSDSGLFGNTDPTVDLRGALLPGGRTGLTANGFGVSAGTERPELAYEFAKYLTSYPDVSNLIFTQTPARRSLTGITAEGGIFGGFNVEYSPEDQAFVDQAIESALPAAELRFSDYLDAAIDRVLTGEATVTDSLDQSERGAFADLSTADNWQADNEPVVVASPVPTPVLTAGEISMRFGLNLFSDDIPNEAEWNRLIGDFIAQNPAVGNIELIPPSFGFGLGDDPALEYDCYYEPFNSVQSINLQTVLPFDPFMDTDPTFDRDDFIGDTIQQVTRENGIWAYPIVIQPEILWYDDFSFQNAGVTSPEGGWTVDQFTDALDFLRFVMENPDEEPTFVPETFDNVYLLMLIAAYGGLPYDYSTSPPTVALTEPTNLEAIRQVLDLAKEGYVGYQALGFEGNPGGPNQLFELEGLALIFTDTLNTFNFRIQQRGENEELQDYRLTNYPRGNEYVPLSYTVGTAYITAETQNAEACYEWINFIAQRPDLFRGLPARRSLINNPDITAAQGEDVTTLYTNYIELLNAPNAVVIPSIFAEGNIAIGPILESQWINRAFDNYVLEDGDLEADLAEAELFISEYRTCSEDIPPFDIRAIETLNDALASVRDYADCAVRVDPSLQPLFEPILGS
jgi:ABC-type glycerol-3-phosphate transport system substrate-binding protein